MKYLITLLTLASESGNGDSNIPSSVVLHILAGVIVGNLMVISRSPISDYSPVGMHWSFVAIAALLTAPLSLLYSDQIRDFFLAIVATVISSSLVYAATIVYGFYLAGFGEMVNPITLQIAQQLVVFEVIFVLSYCFGLAVGYMLGLRPIVDREGG